MVQWLEKWSLADFAICEVIIIYSIIALYRLLKGRKKKNDNR